MQRICFVLTVRPDRVDEYRSRHATVWPDMLIALKKCGWNNYSLFLREDGLLVGYLEADDFDAAQRAMAATEVDARWQGEMSEFFESPLGARPDEAIRPLAEVFHLEDQLERVS